MNLQKGSAFMNLPGESRNKIYEYLFAGKTVHVDTSPAHLQSYEVETENGAIPLYYSLVVPKLRGKLCGETSSRHNRFLTLADPSRAQKHPSYAEGTAAFELPSTSRTLDNAICNGVKCTNNAATTNNNNYDHTTTTVLSLQLLRVCKKIHSEAAKIPYAETFFIIDDAHRPLHHEAIRRAFGADNRAAISNAALHNVGERLFFNIPDLFPRLRRVWLDLDDYPVQKLNRHLAKFCSLGVLEGAAIRIWTDSSSLYKVQTVLRMEKALLGDRVAMTRLSSDS
jgi:hypothetical protein